ncbi:MAG: flavodoxin [Solobacterium sp.]|nr:flavodoxin [Solobacterium sp.]
MIIYYSQARGNTRRIAELIHAEKGYDLCSIETAEPYTGTYQEIVDLGQEEVENHYKPVLKPLDVSLEQYDRLIVMTPTWWYTMAPAVLCFLSEHSFVGKMIVPVQTHGGWPGHTINDMKAAAPGATFQNAFAVQFDSTGGDELVTGGAEILNWIHQL